MNLQLFRMTCPKSWYTFKYQKTKWKQSHRHKAVLFIRSNQMILSWVLSFESNRPAWLLSFLSPSSSRFKESSLNKARSKPDHVVAWLSVRHLAKFALFGSPMEPVSLRCIALPVSRLARSSNLQLHLTFFGFGAVLYLRPIWYNVLGGGIWKIQHVCNTSEGN